MKTLQTLLFLLLSLALATRPAGAQVPAETIIGAPAPALRFAAVQNAPRPTTSLAALRGRVVLLEFWGTYCAPCVAAMPHLQQLQKQFAGRLQVLAISQETPARVARYLAARPSNLWFAAVGPAQLDSLQRLFSYHIVPHTVLIDAAGRVVASTDPRHVTAGVIDSVLRGLPVRLPLVKDDLVENPMATYFPANAATPPHFLIQPAMQGLGSMMRTYPQNSSVFHNRRLIAINLPLAMLYRLAYGDPSDYRTLDLRPKAPAGAPEPMYCFDLIVARGQEATLRPTLRRELAARFELRAALEPRTKPVYLLKVANARRLPPAVGPADAGTAASGGGYEAPNAPLATLADYLEGFGVVKRPVLDATGLATRYNLHFEFQPEKPGDLQRALGALGLVLEEAERPVDVLVLR
ncbi:TIGR03435 family protein [Hymenobacter coccineus]|uniref:Thioredoxin domain-containing protein n=1 Tax=Hymenobacter coccineus TaxID=1908235 RepID=A0A1G1SVN1_9BACT|nr:TIGR03435 family protein [Hymenobacter coccineus]OGX82688.1 hypothetical protein BEN49_13425 [Hymenobacter coccineus]